MSCKLRECFVLLNHLKEEEIRAAQSTIKKERSHKWKGAVKQKFVKGNSHAKSFDLSDSNQLQEDKFVQTRSRTKCAREVNRNCNFSSKYSRDDESEDEKKCINNKRSREYDSDRYPKRIKVGESSGESVKRKTRSSVKDISHYYDNTNSISSNLTSKFGNENKSDTSAAGSVEAEAFEYHNNKSSTSKSNTFSILSEDNKTSQSGQLSPSKNLKTMSAQRKKNLNEKKRKNTVANYSTGINETKINRHFISTSELGSTLTTNDAFSGAKGSNNPTQLMQQSFSNTIKPYTWKKNKTALNSEMIEPVHQSKNIIDDKRKESCIKKTLSVLRKRLKINPLQAENEKSNAKRIILIDDDKTKNTMTSPSFILKIPNAEQIEEFQKKGKTNSSSNPKSSPLNHESKSTTENKGLHQKETFNVRSKVHQSLTNRKITIPVEKINNVYKLKDKEEFPVSKNLFRSNNKPTGHLRRGKEGLKVEKKTQSFAVSTIQRSPIEEKIQKFSKIPQNATQKKYPRLKIGKNKEVKYTCCPICDTKFLNKNNRKMCKNCKISKHLGKIRRWKKTAKKRIGIIHKNHTEFSRDVATSKQLILERDTNNSKSQNEIVDFERREENSKNVTSETNSESDKNRLHCAITNTTSINIEDEGSESTINGDSPAKDFVDHSFLKKSHHDFENKTIRELDALTLLAITDNEKDPRSGISFRAMLTDKFLKILKQETIVTPEITEKIATCKYILEVLTLAKKYLCLFGSFEKVSDYFLRKQEKADVDERTSTEIDTSFQANSTAITPKCSSNDERFLSRVKSAPNSKNQEIKDAGTGKNVCLSYESPSLNNALFSIKTEILKPDLLSSHKKENTESCIDFDNSMINDLNPNSPCPTVSRENDENNRYFQTNLDMENAENNRDFHTNLDVQVLYPRSPCPTINMELSKAALPPITEEETTECSNSNPLSCPELCSSTLLSSENISTSENSSVCDLPRKYTGTGLALTTVTHPNSPLRYCSSYCPKDVDCAKVTESLLSNKVSNQENGKDTNNMFPFVPESQKIVSGNFSNAEIYSTGIDDREQGGKDNPEIGEYSVVSNIFTEVLVSVERCSVMNLPFSSDIMFNSLLNLPSISSISPMLSNSLGSNTHENPRILLDHRIENQNIVSKTVIQSKIIQ